MAENRTRINCLEGNYADHYTTNALCWMYFTFIYTLNLNEAPPGSINKIRNIKKSDILITPFIYISSFSQFLDIYI